MMGFWLRNFVLSVVLLGLAYAFFINQDLLLSLDPTYKPKMNSSNRDKTANSFVKRNAEKINSENSAADGLSNFYASIRADIGKKGPRIRNNVVFLPEPKGSLINILEARRMVTRPLRKTWKGTKANRPFRKGETLFQKLSQYANNDGVEVIWWLNKDLIIKDAFRINKNITYTAYQIGKALEGHFQDGLTAHFCYQQRAIVLIEGNIDYLKKECLLLSSQAK